MIRMKPFIRRDSFDASMPNRSRVIESFACEGSNPTQ
jgi:hypothetical protein